QDEMISHAGTGDEPFVAPDDPAIALALGPRADHAGIGAAARRRFRHREGGANAPLDDRPQPLVLLRRRTDLGEDIHVAVVRRGAVEAYRSEDRAVGFFIHRRPAHDGQPHAAEFLWGLWSPQTGGLRQAAHALKDLEADILVVVEVGAIGFERKHMRFDEFARAQPDLLEGRRGGGIHWFPFNVAASTFEAYCHY